MTEWNRVGRSSVFIPMIGIGTMNFGRDVCEAAAAKLLDAAFSCGIRLIDSAELYPHPISEARLGLAENIIGKWLKTKPRDSVVLSTKFSGPSIGHYTSPARGGRPGMDGCSIRRAIEGSLLRLGTDYIDIIQPHWPDHSASVDSMLLTLTTLANEGKIRIFGCSNDTPWGLMKMLWRADVLGSLRPESTQQRHNCIYSSLTTDLQEILVQEELALIAYEPLAGGVLTGKYLSESPNGRYSASHQTNDKNMKDSQTMIYFSERATNITKTVKRVAMDFAVAPAALALATSCYNRYCTSVLIGARTPAQIENLATVMDRVKYQAPVRHLTQSLTPQA